MIDQRTFPSGTPPEPEEPEEEYEGKGKGKAVTLAERPRQEVAGEAASPPESKQKIVEADQGDAREGSAPPAKAAKSTDPETQAQAPKKKKKRQVVRDAVTGVGDCKQS